MDQQVAFESRFLISWAATGAIVGLIFGIIAVAAGGSAGYLLSVPFNVTAIYSAYGGLGMLFDAALRHSWQFGNIRHQVWIWYIYPIVGLFDIIFTLTLGFLMYCVKSMFRM